MENLVMFVLGAVVLYIAYSWYLQRKRCDALATANAQLEAEKQRLTARIEYCQHRLNEGDRVLREARSALQNAKKDHLVLAESVKTLGERLAVYMGRAGQTIEHRNKAGQKSRGRCVAGFVDAKFPDHPMLVMESERGGRTYYTIEANRDDLRVVADPER